MAVSLSSAAAAPKWSCALLSRPGKSRDRFSRPCTGPINLQATRRVDALAEGHTDPVSGQPELKFTPVALAPYPASWQGFAVSEQAPQRAGLDYWALARTKAGFRLELAGLSSRRRLDRVRS